MSDNKNAPAESLAAKLARIMAEVDRIPKRGRNAHHGYDYATDADVLDSVRGRLTAEGILLIPSVESVTQVRDDIVRLTVLFRYIDATTGETIEFRGVGDGQDKQDKGPYKAMTGALKYAITKSLLIPTGDDPEADHGQDQGQGQKPPSRPAAKPAPRPAPKPAAKAPAPAQAPSQEPPTGQGRPTTGGYATDAQVNAIRKLSASQGLDEAQAIAKLAAVVGHKIKGLEDLTTAEASQAIGFLNKSKKAA